MAVVLNDWCICHTCQRSQFSWESPSFSSKFLVSQLEHQISWEIPTMAFFQIFFINFITFKMSKRKIIKKVDLELFFELFSKQRNQIDIYLTSIIIGQKSTDQIAQYIVESWRGFCSLLSSSGTFRGPLGDFQRVFGHCRIWHSYNTKISRRLQIFVLRGLAGMIC